MDEISDLKNQIKELQENNAAFEQELAPIIKELAKANYIRQSFISICAKYVPEVPAEIMMKNPTKTTEEELETLDRVGSELSAEKLTIFQTYKILSQQALELVNADLAEALKPLVILVPEWFELTEEEKMQVFPF